MGQGILIASAAVGRASLIAYLLYILWSQKLQRIAMITLAVMEVSINLGAIIVIFAGCKPTALNWDYSLPGTCASPQVTIDFGYFQSSKLILERSFFLRLQSVERESLEAYADFHPLRGQYLML